MRRRSEAVNGYRSGVDRHKFSGILGNLSKVPLDHKGRETNCRSLRGNVTVIGRSIGHKEQVEFTG